MYEKVRNVETQCKWYSVCPMKYYFEAGKLDEKWVKEYCHGDWSICVRYHLEESGQYHPDNMLPDGSIANDL
ncbi:MAG TPA: uracil-DNA glycosylase [Candidatus Cloacimonetes bacterium]|nr:uracil-DNA glycosylase [Candidatus Cloacimonadota bacterium]HEX38118.1 uracil-DNA glycosylase [Candidatus Cloacimonadota bacterium]